MFIDNTCILDIYKVMNCTLTTAIHVPVYLWFITLVVLVITSATQRFVEENKMHTLPVHAYLETYNRFQVYHSFSLPDKKRIYPLRTGDWVQCIYFLVRIELLINFLSTFFCIFFVVLPRLFYIGSTFRCLLIVFLITYVSI